MASRRPNDIYPAVTSAAWLPHGAILFSAVALQRRMVEKSSSAAQRAIYGRTKPGANLFAVDAEAVAKRLFRSEITARQVLDRHSLFSFYRHFLPLIRETDLAERLSSGEASVCKEYLPLRARTGPSRGALRHCSACVAEDEAVHGFGPWYACHQVPFIKHCHKHFTSLVWRCVGCGAALQTGYSSRLPGEQCGHCKRLSTSRRIEYSEGQAHLGTICAELCVGGESTFRPTTWSAIVDRTVDLLGGLELAVLVLEDEIQRRWNVSSISELRRSFPGLLAMDFVRDELQSLAGPGEVGGRLIVRGAIEGVVGSATFRGVVSQSLEAPADHPTALAEVIAANAGVPIGALRLLAQGQSIRTTARSANIGYASLRRFVIQLSDLTTDPEVDGDVISFIVEGLNEPRRKLRIAARNAVSAALTEKRPLSRGGSGPLAKYVAWLQRNDRVWLETSLPYQLSLQPSADSTKKMTFRKEILGQLQLQQVAMLSASARRAWPAAQWLYDHDRDWFNQRFPPRRRLKYRDDAHKKATFREAVRDLVLSRRGLTRAIAKAELGGKWNWLTRHDRQWTLRQVPKRVARATKT